MNTDWEELKSEIQNILDAYENEYGPIETDDPFFTIINRVEAQITLAEKRGYSRGIEEEGVNCYDHCEKAREEGARAVIEKAEEIAESWKGDGLTLKRPDAYAHFVVLLKEALTAYKK